MTLDDVVRALSQLETLSRDLLAAAEAGDLDQVRRLLDQREQIVGSMPPVITPDGADEALERLEKIQALDEAVRLRLEEQLALTRQMMQDVQRKQVAVQGYRRAGAPSDLLDVYR